VTRRSKTDPDPVGTAEVELGPSEQHRRIIHVAPQPGHRHPPLLHARFFAFDEAGGTREPDPASRQIAHVVGEEIAEADARHRCAAALPRRRELANGRREVRDRRVEVEHCDCRSGPFELSLSLVIGHHHDVIVARPRSAGGFERWARPQGDDMT